MFISHHNSGVILKGRSFSLFDHCYVKRKGFKRVHMKVLSCLIFKQTRLRLSVVTGLCSFVLQSVRYVSQFCDFFEVPKSLLEEYFEVLK